MEVVELDLPHLLDGIQNDYIDIQHEDDVVIIADYTQAIAIYTTLREITVH